MKQLIRSIKEYCVDQYETIAVAENITTGCLQMLLGSVEQAGQYFLGGITLNNEGQLFEQLGVTPVEGQKNSAGLALTIDMAKKVAVKFNSEIGIAVHGSDTDPQSLFGPAYAAIVRFNKVIYAEKLMPAAQSPNAIPVEYAQRIIRVLAERLMPAQEELPYTTSEILEPLS